MNCPKCGTEIPETAKFCTMCGEKIVGVEEEKIGDIREEFEDRIKKKPEEELPEEKPEKDILKDFETLEKISEEKPEVKNKKIFFYSGIALIIISLLIGGVSFVPFSKTTTEKVTKYRTEEYSEEVTNYREETYYEEKTVEERIIDFERRPMEDLKEVVLSQWKDEITENTLEISTPLFGGTPNFDTYTYQIAKFNVGVLIPYEIYLEAEGKRGEFIELGIYECGDIHNVNLGNIYYSEKGVKIQDFVEIPNYMGWCVVVKNPKVAQPVKIKIDFYNLQKTTKIIPKKIQVKKTEKVPYIKTITKTRQVPYVDTIEKTEKFYYREFLYSAIPLFVVGLLLFVYGRIK